MITGPDNVNVRAGDARSAIAASRVGWRSATAAVLFAAVASAGCSKPTDRPAALPPDCKASRGTDLTTSREGQRVFIHLPPCYAEHPTSRYPVIVLIHGAGADETQWPDVGIVTTADRMTGTGDIGPAILVVPNFGDSPSASEADVVTTKIVPWLDSRYRTIPDPEHRAVGGISRGGGAALLAAGARPDLFGIVGAHSPAVSGDLNVLRDGLTAIGGNIWIDVGTSDGLHDTTVGFADSLKRSGIAVEMHVQPGRHDRAYWRANVDDYLRFYASRWR